MKKQLKPFIFLTCAFMCIVLFSCNKNSDNLTAPVTMGTTTTTISPQNVTVSTLAGGNEPALGVDADGIGSAATLAIPSGIALDASGNLFVSEYGSGASIRKVTPTGIVTTVTGLYASAVGIAIDGNGYIYFTDAGYLHQIKPDGTEVTNFYFDPAVKGSTPSYGIAAWKNKVYFTEVYSSVIYQINGNISSIFAHGPTSDISNYAIAVDATGNIFYGSTTNVYKITPDSVLSVYAGSGVAGSADGPAAKASFNGIAGIAVDKNDNLFIADAGNNKIRMITANGVVSTIAGTGALGITDGTGDKATFITPQGIAISADGTTLYEADGYRIRKITLNKQ
jgi:sugar lactone lactonase YvrE